MKKAIFAIAMVLTLAITACSTAPTTETTSTTDSTTVMVDTLAIDSAITVDTLSK
jgi:hypothetical protein